jgi:hypothetical protein
MKKKKKRERKKKKQEGCKGCVTRSIAAQASVLLVVKILSNGENVLSRATQVTREDRPVCVRKQISQLFYLPRELGVRIHIRRRIYFGLR